jgi:catechol 2,3-dioxygenase-like lactoylglutathione lyase family enzyme
MPPDLSGIRKVMPPRNPVSPVNRGAYDFSGTPPLFALIQTDIRRFGMLLGEKNAIATIAVRNIEAAKRFYEGILELKLVHAEGPKALSYKSGDAEVLVYESQFAGTNRATAVTWVVDQLEKIVQTLKAKGVQFEHYDMPGVTRQGDVHVAGSIKNAWFKDPDGNILAMVSH